MDKFSKQVFLENFPQLQACCDEQQCWPQLAADVSGYAQVLLQQRRADGESGAVLPDWWKSCALLLANHQVVINDINFDGSREGGKSEEYIEILNKGPLLLDLSGWKINAGNQGQDMTFVKGTLLYPDSMVRVYTAKAGELSFNSKQSVWNNKGDQAFLYDANNELICRWCYGIKAHSEVAITYINFDGHEKRTEADEYIEIANIGGNIVDLSHWQLSAGKKQEFTFPEKSVLPPYTRIRVYTNQIDKQTGGYSFNSPTAIWNNKGDTGVLCDDKGHLVSDYSYGGF